MVFYYYFLCLFQLDTSTISLLQTAMSVIIIASLIYGTTKIGGYIHRYNSKKNGFKKNDLDIPLNFIKKSDSSIKFDSSDTEDETVREPLETNITEGAVAIVHEIPKTEEQEQPYYNTINSSEQDQLSLKIDMCRSMHDGCRPKERRVSSIPIRKKPVNQKPEAVNIV